MPRRHLRSFQQFLRRYGADDPQLAPLIGDEVLPVVLVDDVSYVLPPIVAPVQACSLVGPAIAGLYSISEIEAGPTGALLRYGVLISVGAMVLTTGTLITGNLTTLVPGIATGNPQSIFRHGTSAAFPGTTLSVDTYVLAAGEAVDGIYMPPNTTLVCSSLVVNTAVNWAAFTQEPIGETA
jgi:hypothetical protein